MAAHSKDKVIQVQKPAQSLQAFQKKVASGEDIQAGYLKPLLLGAGVLVVATASYFGFVAWRANALEQHQTALADLQLEIGGDSAVAGTEPVSAQDLEKRMRDHLPQLEALARNAPAEDRTVTQSLLATWQVELGEKGAAHAAPTDTWGRLRLAQRQIALGQAQEAAATLTPLRRSADPDEPWASLFWSTLMDADRLQGDRTQALKDLAEYKARFKQLVDPSVEQLLAGV
jgi:predicted Zn-dependent protease